MLNYIGFIMLMLFFVLMVGRGAIMKRNGITLLVVGQKNKRELPSFLLGYALMIYIVASNCFPLPMFAFANRFFWNAEWLRWAGAAVCAASHISFIVCMVSFGNSFRVGIDEKHAGELVTTGIYARSRNPMYTSLDALFFGIFLIFPNPGVLFVLAMITLTFHLQIKNEEAFCRKHYGTDYIRYCKKVRRYL
ncbi:MAG: isoprenylcysteine carboxylmethyltransferase family protein [Oscillospiraceae bacterium]|jgi:protein-S-isoprenylcysteine O-methyltransferase Ste14|nr:isoprenylcysteine carboxylmethyltransferase family protein [Oscillospiraceae bacterium]